MSTARRMVSECLPSPSTQSPQRSEVCMRRYEIYDQDADGVLLFDLKDVLTQIQEAGHFESWRLIEFEAVGPDVLSIEGAVAKSKGGVSLSWSVLLELAGSFEQVINLRLVGGDQSTAGNETRDEKVAFFSRFLTVRSGQ